ncbi:MAG: substrate-binding domain-containing protein [Myxococcales bacterium]|nr:substrate-binding domain-containing protein [Myxococcales bacterium]
MTGRPLTPWLWSATMIAVVGLIAAGVVAFTERGDAPPALISEPVSPKASVGGEPLQIAGSGSNLPLTTLLVEAFRRTFPDVRVELHESIGSSGAFRATRDGAIDIGLVSRPARSGEEEGLRRIPYAATEAVFAVHPSVPDRTISKERLLNVYGGQRGYWNDGSVITVLQREKGDSSHRAVEAEWPEFASVNEDAWKRERLRVIYSDQAMHQALIEVKGAMGLCDASALAISKSPLVRLTVEGEGPFSKEFAFVVVPNPGDGVRRFLDFALGERGREIVEEAGATPIPRALDSDAGTFDGGS